MHFVSVLSRQVGARVLVDRRKKFMQEKRAGVTVNWSVAIAIEIRRYVESRDAITCIRVAYLDS